MAVSMLTMTPSLTVSAQDYQDKSAVLDTGFTLDTDYTLKLANPSKDTSTTAENYYITGSSDPDYPLTLQWRRGGGPRYLWFFWNLCSAGDGR